MDERHLGKKLRILSNQVSRKIDNKVASLGLEITSNQARIIGFLNRMSTKRDVYQKDIEEEFDIRRSSVTNILQNLEKHGYIRRESVPMDARLKKIVLTEKGISINELVLKQIRGVENSLSQVYTEDELEQLYYLLDKLSKSLCNNSKNE